MQYESERNLTFRIYFSGLLGIALLVQQRGCEGALCAGNTFQPMGGGNMSVCVECHGSRRAEGARGKCMYRSQ